MYNHQLYLAMLLAPSLHAHTNRVDVPIFKLNNIPVLVINHIALTPSKAGSFSLTIIPAMQGLSLLITGDAGRLEIGIAASVVKLKTQLVIWSRA
jgi:hypothetical protein